MWRLVDFLILTFGTIFIILSYLYLVLRFLVAVPIIMPILFIIASITKFKYTNCWIFVCYKYITEGGYIVFRRTKWNKWKWLNWEHAAWTPDLKKYYSYKPLCVKSKRVFPPLLFHGKVVIEYGLI